MHPCAVNVVVKEEEKEALIFFFYDTAQHKKTLVRFWLQPRCRYRPLDAFLEFCCLRPNA